MNKILGGCWQWETNGQCVKGDNCCFRQARVPVEECFDCPARIPSNELATIRSVTHGIFQYSWFASLRMDADLVKSDLMRIARLKHSPAKGLKRLVTKVQWLSSKGMRAASKNRETCFGRLLIKYTTIGLCLSGCGAAEAFLEEELRHAETNPTCKTHESYCTSRRQSRPKSIARIFLPR